MMTFALAAALALTGPADAAVSLTSPQAIVEVDTGKLKGDPGMLAWSPDGTELYLEMVDRDRRGAVTAARHFLISIAGKSLKPIDQQPPWATSYWAWKAGQSSPASPAFKIAVDERNEVKRATAAVGDLAKGGGGSSGRGIPGTTAEEAVAAQASTQVLHIYVLKVGSETIGEWTNEPVMVGVNFGWAPKPLRLIAYTKRDSDTRDGPLQILDEGGRKQTLAGPKSASLPAWSDDGSRMAWLERKDRKKFDVIVATVSMQ